MEQEGFEPGVKMMDDESNDSTGEVEVAGVRGNVKNRIFNCPYLLQMLIYFNLFLCGVSYLCELLDKILIMHLLN